MNEPTLVIIEARHMYAGVIVADGVIQRAAPILAWSVGHPYKRLARWAHRKGYRVHLRA